MVRVAARPVLDSDILIDYLRGAGPGRTLLERLRGSLAYWVTAISAFELSLGRSYDRDPTPVDALLAVSCLNLTRAAAVKAGGLLRDLHSEGEGLDIRDALQAGICLEARVPLVTRNTRHFERIAGLATVHPDAWEARP